MARIVITGASRGIGLALTKLYASEGWDVTASCRDPSGAGDLKKASREYEGRIEVERCDVSDTESTRSFGERMKGKLVDVLVNNAGVSGDMGAGLGTMDYGKWREVLDVNVMGPMRVTEALEGNLGEGSKVAALSSRLGSIGLAGGDLLVYRTSKAGVNMVMKVLSGVLGKRGVYVVSLHPGWVRTEMGGVQAPVTPRSSAEGLKKVLDGLGEKEHGGFYTFEGEELPW